MSRTHSSWLAHWVSALIAIKHQAPLRLFEMHFSSSTLVENVDFLLGFSSSLSLNDLLCFQYTLPSREREKLGRELLHCWQTHVWCHVYSITLPSASVNIPNSLHACMLLTAGRLVGGCEGNATNFQLSCWVKSSVYLPNRSIRWNATRELREEVLNSHSNKLRLADVKIEIYFLYPTLSILSVTK